MKCAKLNRTLLTWGMIEPFMNNGFPTRRGKSLKLEMLDIDSRLTGLQNRQQGRHMKPLVFLARDFGNSPEDKIPLIEHWNAPSF